MKHQYTRTCQSCGHAQPSAPAAKPPTDAWLNAKCAECKSPSLDYGSVRAVMTRSDQNIVDNLRHRWRDQLAPYSDEMLAEEYEAFGQSDMHGDNDARFLEWLGLAS